MSEAPSWLTEENISVASKVASNPAVQSAAKSHAKKELNKQAPGWASSDDIESGKKPEKVSKPTSPVASAPAAPKPVINTDMSDVDPETMKGMQRWHLILRCAYIASSVLLCTAAALSLNNQNDIGLAFFAFYVFFFAAMICCFEVALNMVSRLIAVNFGFMYTLVGRFIFLLLVGFMAFLLSVLGKIAMAVLYSCFLLHGFIMYKFPRFEEYLRKKHYYDGRQAEATHK